MSTAPDLRAVRRVFVVHGYQAAPDRHWFPWLVEQLAAEGFAVTVVELPDSETPMVRAWSETLAAAVGEVDSQTWFVGHSLGCITVLRYLGGLAGPWSAAGVVLVAGFDGPMASVPELHYFLADRLDADAGRRIIERVPRRRMIRSDDDVFVPAAASDALAAVIDAPVVVIPGAGHFMGSDGILELPLVRDIITGRDSTVGYEPMAAKLETERLLLEPMQRSDAERYVELIAERGPDGRGHGTDVDRARSNIARMAEEAAVSGIGFLALRRPGEPDMIGYCGLLVGRASLDEPEIAYELLAREHGHGYATEAARAVVEAAQATGRRRLWSTVAEWNTASFRVLDKLGFSRHHTVAGPPGADVVYLTRSL